MADAVLPPLMLLAGCQAVVRFGIACLFAAAAIAKLRRREDFARAVAGYRLLPDAAVWPVAAILPPIELIVAAGLVAGLSAGFVAAAALLALFAGAMAVNLLRGRKAIDCGCDPSARAKPIGWALVLRNLVLGGLLLAGLVPAPALPLPLLAASAGVGIIACLLAHILTLLGSFARPGAAIRASGAR